VRDPQAAAAGAFVDMPAPGGGTSRAIATPVAFGATEPITPGPVPALGEHTERVLRESGVDEAACDALRRAGVFGRRD
jgi:crotonobetainyl-CoA:carnitine CoA-transferase CaiB-like acyl-CoA transferase